VALMISLALMSIATAGQRLFPTDSCPTPATCSDVMAGRMDHSFRLIDRLSVINVTHKTVDESCISLMPSSNRSPLSASRPSAVGYHAPVSPTHFTAVLR
jgi:hypothetical protein